MRRVSRWLVELSVLPAAWFSERIWVASVSAPWRIPCLRLLERVTALLWWPITLLEVVSEVIDLVLPLPTEEGENNA